MRTKRLIFATFFAFFLQALNYAISVAADRSSASGVYDVVITNGKIVDGSGNPWFYADVAIKNGKIAKIGKVDSRMGKRVIDAKGWWFHRASSISTPIPTCQFWRTAMSKARCVKA